ncbi:MAG TPA: hypothetical protein VGI81_28815 [Tepidisphaeraceae bacterium]|jgi:hypothetical protein
MRTPITFSLPDGGKVQLSDQVFMLDRERKVLAVEQAALLKFVFPNGTAEGVPPMPPVSVTAHLKHKKLLDRKTGRPTEYGEHLAGVLLGGRQYSRSLYKSPTLMIACRTK